MTHKPLVSHSLRSVLRLVLPTVALTGFLGCDTIGGTGLGDLGSGHVDMTVISHFGLVRMASTTSTVGSQTTSGSSATAFFFDKMQQDAGCARTDVGACSLYACAGSTFTLPSAGSITVTGGTQAVGLTTRGDGSYVAFANSSSIVFPQGQKLILDAAGQSAPAFHAELTPPTSAFNLTIPDGTRGDPLILSVGRNRDFQVTWSPLLAGTRVHAELNQSLESNHALLLECDYDGTAGNGTLPGSLLAKFMLTSGQFNVAQLLIGPSAATSVKQNGWDISVVATSAGREGRVTITD